MVGIQIFRRWLSPTLASLAFSSTLRVVKSQTDPIVFPPCNDLLMGENEIIGSVCSEVVAGVIEIEVTTTSSDCLIFESHICNVPTEQFRNEGGVKTVPYALNVEEVYDFVCSGFGGDTFIIAGHATLQCGASTEPLASYYEIELFCSPDGTLTGPGMTVETTPAAVVRDDISAVGTTAGPTTPGAVDTPGGRPAVVTTPGATKGFNVDTTGGESALLGGSCQTRTEPCPEGTYVTETCDCSPVHDPCAACPSGTRCQKPKGGVPLLCIACECGFCAAAEHSCCEVNAHGNNCKDATNAKECNLQNDFYPTFIGSGNACAGVEVVHNVPSGCGCVPSRETSCAYDPSEQSLDSRCYVCDNDDLLIARNDEDHPCYECRICMKTCGACIGAAKSLEDMATCMRSKSMGDCRKTCGDKCLKT